MCAEFIGAGMSGEQRTFLHRQRDHGLSADIPRFVAQETLGM
jgi:hypothetical protein